MELTRNNRRMIASLATAKGRREHGLFVAEGTKCVLETISTFDVETVLATRQWLDQHATQLPMAIDVTEVKRQDIKELSSLSTPADVMAVYHMPHTQPQPISGDELSIALDCVQDPGNLGTIVRIAAWMGVEHVYCSTDTVDLYNPKTVQATMGALARVKVHYGDLAAMLADAADRGVAVYGTFLDGANIYNAELTPGGVLVMGNEGQGIGDEVARLVNRRLYIPPYPAGTPGIESLNVAVATAIATAEFRRRMQ